MKRMLKTLALIAILASSGGCALLDTASQDTSTDDASAAPVTFIYPPLQCRVKMGYTATFTYTPRDRSDAADYVIGEFERRLEADGNNGNGYAIAQGEQPDLNINITVNSDDSNNRTMHVVVQGSGPNVPVGTSSDGRTYSYYYEINTNATYRDVDAMIDDMADRINGWVSGGWSKTIG